MYRLYTERKNVQKIKDLLVALHLDFTIYYGDGSYLLCPEKSITIELDGVTGKAAKNAAAAIKKMNKQDRVLLQRVHTESVLV